LEVPAVHHYQRYRDAACPFSFEYSTLARIERDSQWISSEPGNDCWLNIVYPDYDATIYLSYKTPEEDYNLLKLRNEAHRLTYEHAKRADYIEPQLITAPNQIYALVYNVGGAAASPTQFFVTDTVNHWLRGALYFKTSPNPDSLEPLINYIDEDIGRLIRSIRWE
jgi:gliding motility-associated lipoprotein GldD